MRLGLIIADTQLRARENCEVYINSRYGSRSNPKLRQPLFRLEERFSKPDRGVRIAPKSSKVSGRSWVAKYPVSTASSGSLYLNILNLVKDLCSILHCIKDVEDLVAPSGDERDVVTDKPYRCLTISLQVEEV